MQIIFDYNRTLFNPETGKLYTGIFMMLKKLAKKHKLFLITMNEPERKNTIKELGIDQYFRQILFVEQKTEEVFKNMVAQNETVIVIGDRLQGEIQIGVQLGFITIHIQHDTSMPTPSLKMQPTHTANSAKKIIEIISIYEK